MVEQKNTRQPDFKNLFESSPALFLVLSPDFAIVAVSDAYLTVTKTKREQIIGRELFEVFPDNPEDPFATGVANLKASLIKVLNTKAPDTLTEQKYDIPRPDAEGGGFEERFWRSLNCPVLNTNHELTHIILRVEDITEFIRLKQKGAEEIFRLNDALTVNAIKLEQALFQEKALSDLKSRFVTTASHEFRTPLGTILSSTDLIQSFIRVGQVEKTEKHLERIKKSVKNLTDILNDFLSIEKLQSGKVSSESSKFNLKELLEEIAVELSGTGKDGQSINLNFTGREDICLDKKIVRNIVLNLVSNAIKYSDNHVQLNATIKNGLATVEVKDEGIGIPKEEQKHLFELFFRARNASTIQGTGLGLNIVKRYLQVIGGTIDFVSAESKGATFTVMFPAKTGSQDKCQ